tara:strand:+ start:101 stop:490 length:390 start_codon:yes stop_codon:yes gene_type:complete
MVNIHAMKRAVQYQWTSTRLPCRITLIPKDIHPREDFVGTLEEMSLHKGMRIVRMTLEFNGMRFFTPECVLMFFKQDYDAWDAEDIDQWVLDSICPLVPGCSRNWLHPTAPSLKNQLDRNPLVALDIGA